MNSVGSALADVILRTTEIPFAEANPTKLDANPIRPILYVFVR